MRSSDSKSHLIARSRVGEEIALLTTHRPGLADFPHPVPHLAGSLRDYTARESNPPDINKISAHDVFKSILLSRLSLSLIGFVSGRLRMSCIVIRPFHKRC